MKNFLQKYVLLVTNVIQYNYKINIKEVFDMNTKIRKEDYKKVTSERIKYVAKMYRDSIKDIYTDGKVYLVELNEGYEVEGKTKLEAKNITKICYFSWLATDIKTKKDFGKDAKMDKGGRIAVPAMK